METGAKERVYRHASTRSRALSSTRTRTRMRVCTIGRRASRRMPVPIGALFSAPFPRDSRCARFADRGRRAPR
eukprot:5083837-Pleurochrysis_carterae.AAC.1